MPVVNLSRVGVGLPQVQGTPCTQGSVVVVWHWPGCGLQTRTSSSRSSRPFAERALTLIVHRRGVRSLILVFTLTVLNSPQTALPSEEDTLILCTAEQLPVAFTFFLKEAGVQPGSG